MIVHGVPPSPYTRKVVVVLEEKGIAYERRDLVPFPKSPELLAMHPQGLIPVLEDGGRMIPDSSVICAYIERVHPERPMYPEEPGAFADAMFLEEYADTTVMGSIAPVFGERFVKPQVFGQESDEGRVQEALANGIPPVFDYLEARLNKGAESLLENFGVADAALGNYLACLDLSGEKIDAARWPKLSAYHDALLARPSFRVAMPSA